GRRDRVRAAEIPAHPDDGVRLHPGRGAADAGQRRGLGRPERHGHGGVLGHARRHRPRRVHHPRQLRVRAGPAVLPAEIARAGSGGGGAHAASAGASVKRSAPWPLAALLLAGCTVGPDYVRPTVDAPADFRGALAPATAESLGDLRWWQLFPDETLQSLIRTALDANYDVRIAAARILAARAQVTITRSFQFPELAASGSAPYSRIEGQVPSSAIQVRELWRPAGGLDLSFEIDLWGRFRRATEAARAELLASEDARAFVITTLVSDVGAAYFLLRALDQELDIARHTLDLRVGSLQLVQRREAGGVAALMDVRQAETLVA